MPKIHHVKKARKDYPEHNIAKGSEYYWWWMRYSKTARGVKRYSKTPPKPSQLTTSPFLSELYSIQESIDAATEDDVEDVIEEAISSVEDLKSTTEESLENIPEQLKDGATGELLKARIEVLEAAIESLGEARDCETAEEKLEALANVDLSCE